MCCKMKNHMFFFPIFHLLAEGTLITSLEVAFVHGPCPTEAHSQPKHQNWCHSTKKLRQTKLNMLKATER